MREKNYEIAITSIERKVFTVIESLLEKELWNSEKDLTEKAIRSRMARARKCEELLGYSLDEAVSTDKRMYESLITLRLYDTNGNYQNSLRWYYKAKTGDAFPLLRTYELLAGIGRQ